MSTVGLTVQETSFPLDNPFLWGSCCTSMDSKSSWGYPLEACPNFSIKSSYTDPKGHSYHRDSPPLSPSIERHKPSPVTKKLPNKSRPAYLSLSCMPEPSTPSPSEDKHILSLRGSSPPQTPSRCSKPLPPIPPQTNSCSEHSLDIDEHFTIPDETCRLVDNQVIKPVRFGLGRRSLRIGGQVNRAFCDNGAQSHRPTQTQHHQHLHQPTYHQANLPHCNHQQTHAAQQEWHEARHSAPQEREEVQLCPRTLDKTQRRVRRTQSGPAGSFNKPAFLNLQARRNAHSTYKPEVPPPLPPRLRTDDPRRWSVEVSGAYSDEDKPPKLPPRDPRGCSRTPSPKTLPLYVNGEMPPTQSFAPDPKYVSYRGLQRQNSEGSPCILPVMVNGHKDSSTHYFLLDGPPPQNTDESHLEWDYGSRRKPQVDFV